MMQILTVELGASSSGGSVGQEKCVQSPMSNFNVNSHWAHLRCLSFSPKLSIWQRGAEATAWMLLLKQWRWFWTSGGTQPHHPACQVDIDESFSHDLKWKLKKHIRGSASCSYGRNSTCQSQKNSSITESILTFSTTIWCAAALICGDWLQSAFSPRPVPRWGGHKTLLLTPSTPDINFLSHSNLAGGCWPAQHKTFLSVCSWASSTSPLSHFIINVL